MNFLFDRQGVVCPCESMGSLFDPIPVREYVTPAQARRKTAEALIQAAYDAAQVLQTAVKDPEASQAQIRACLGVLDRAGFGPHQAITVDDASGLSNIDGMTTDQLRQRAMMLANHAKKFEQAAYDRMNEDDDDDVRPSSPDDDNGPSSSTLH